MKTISLPFSGALLCAIALASCAASNADNEPAKAAPVAVAGDKADANLMIAPPKSEFWYPPYANAQPAWNDGQLKLDLGAAAGKEMAVLSFELPQTLKKGADYTLRFMARSSKVAPLIVLVPQPKTGAKPGDDGKIAPTDSWAQHSTDGQINTASAIREINFKYEPDQLNANKIQFFWDKAAVGEAPQWTFSDFSIVPAGAPAPAVAAAPATQDATPMNADFKASAASPFAAQFWYPPYAEVQPQWQNGTIKVNLDEAKNKGQKMAVLTLKLPADMEKDADYRIRFDALSSAGGALIIQVPEPDARGEKEGDKFKARGDWQMHFPDNNKNRSIVFVNRSQMTVGGPQVALFWGDESVAAGGTWTLSDFEFKKMD